MKVILLTDIPKVGNKYDVKDFKEGYAQNVLLAKGLAILATKSELAKIEAKKKQKIKKKEEEMSSFKELISSVGNKTIVVKAKANEKGHLFKSVNTKDVVLAIKEIANIDIDESSLLMEHIKSVGTFTITISKQGQCGECKIIVEPLK